MKYLVGWAILLFPMVAIFLLGIMLVGFWKTVFVYLCMGIVAGLVKFARSP